MGSRIMHSIIACQIAQSITEIREKGTFLLGGIAPDAVSPKEISHFYSGDGQDFTRKIEFNDFIDKYYTLRKHPYILGYYSHLIADDLWLNGFYTPWLKNRMENNEEIFQLYHHDFRLLNGKLLNYYGNKTEIKELIKNETSLDLEEVNKNDVEKLKGYLMEDMDYPLQDIEENLAVFTFEQIVGYIETSIEKGIFFINRLLHKEPTK